MAVDMRRKTKKVCRVVVPGAVAIGLMIAPSLGVSSRLVVWNVTASMPRGLYLRDPSAISRGAFVLAWLPSAARELADIRGYLPHTVPALKPIAAVAGDVVCAEGMDITINGVLVAERQLKDHQGRDMPHWNGCKTLAGEQVFLLSTYALDSFDGRYFGLSQTSDIIEKVMPIWTF